MKIVLQRRLIGRGLFERVLRTDKGLAKSLMLTTAALLLGPFILLGKLDLRLNASPSLPLGLYIATDQPAALVEFCPEEPFSSLAASRGYRSVGSCPDGASPLMKPIVAKLGDTVELSPRGLSVNGKLLPNTAPLDKDTKGRPLVPWQFGTFAVKQGSVWVASSYNKRSFDSRYFGPIHQKAIRAYARPLLTL